MKRRSDAAEWARWTAVVDEWAERRDAPIVVRAMWTAILEVCARTGGTFSANEVRPLVRLEDGLTYVWEADENFNGHPAKCVGAVISGMLRKGIIVTTGEAAKNTDRASNNSGHPVGVYRIAEYLDPDEAVQVVAVPSVAVVEDEDLMAELFGELRVESRYRVQYAR